MKWIYTGICLKMTYGAIVRASCSTYYKKQLDCIQRLGIVGMAHIGHITPTAGLEAVLNLMPLNQHVECIVVQAALGVHSQNRIKWNISGVMSFGGRNILTRLTSKMPK